MNHNIYIHVPFCISKCNYCAFFSRANISPDWETYTNGIIAEIVAWGRRLNHCAIETVFFGGGTPSLMPVDIFDKIICAIKNNFHLNSDAEITLESNPGTMSDEKLSGFISGGMTRLSIGVQSLNDDDLQFLGRKHDAKTALNLIQNAQSKNIKVSADFIYGLPHQNVDDVISMCKQINSIGLKHVSLYELTIEPSTPFGKMNLEMPDNNTMADMYMAIGDTLNLTRYEVSNYCAPDNECRHNQNVWDGQAYIGVGIGAAGRPNIDGDWYEQLGGNVKCDRMTNSQRAVEMIITGMRTIRGVCLSDEVRNILNFDFINKNPDLVKITNNRLHATEKGLFILDNLTTDLVK